MGNFKPRAQAQYKYSPTPVATKEKTIKDFFVPFTTPDNKGRMMVTNEDAILRALYSEGYEIAQNMVTPKAVWLDGVEKPNIRYSTLMHFQTKGFVEESRKNIPIVFWGLSKTGLKHCERLFGAKNPVKVEPLVKPKPVPLPHVIEAPKPHEDKLKVTDCSTFLNRLPDGSTVVTIHTTSPLMVAKLKIMLGLTEEQPLPKPSGRKPYTFKTSKEVECYYCHDKYTVKREQKDVFRRQCGKLKCMSEYNKDRYIKNKILN